MVALQCCLDKTGQVTGKCFVSCSRVPAGKQTQSPGLRTSQDPLLKAKSERPSLNTQSLTNPPEPPHERAPRAADINDPHSNGSHAKQVRGKYFPFHRQRTVCVYMCVFVSTKRVNERGSHSGGGRRSECVGRGAPKPRV